MWGEGECTREDGLRTQRKSREDKVREGLGGARAHGRKEFIHGNVKTGWVFQPVRGCSAKEKHTNPCPEGNHPLC